jgi:ATP-binding protein involved in chromosome partitioning
MTEAPTHSCKPIPGVKNTIAISSGKGGVGKSTISVNLALALAQAGVKTGLMDADIYGPNIPGMLGVSGPVSVAEDGQRLLPLDGRGLQTISMGVMLERGTPVIWRGPMLAKMIDQLLFSVAWDDLDLLVLDLPPGTGDVQISLTENAPLSGAIIVTTPSDLALADVARGVEMFRQTDIPILGLVVNMSAFICHKCHHATDIFGADDGQRLADQFGLPLLAQVPLDTGLRLAADAGEAFIDSAPDSPAAQAIHELATAVKERLDEAT